MTEPTKEARALTIRPQDWRVLLQSLIQIGRSADGALERDLVAAIEAYAAQRVAEALEQHIRDRYSLKKSDEPEKERILIKRKDFFEAIDKHNEEVIARRAKKKLFSPENSC